MNYSLYVYIHLLSWPLNCTICRNVSTYEPFNLHMISTYSKKLNVDRELQYTNAIKTSSYI